ncbi:MAG: hypothetical protein V4633_25060 [Pseudomonadota bacterium]
MAAWQFALQLVPTAWVAQEGNGVDALCDEDGFDTYHAWLEHQPRSGFATLFESLLPEAPSWSAAVRVWGDEKRTDVYLSYENGFVESIRIRIDVRENTPAVRDKVVAIAKALNCVFFFPGERAIVAPNERTLGEAIGRSRAAQFVNDPHCYLAHPADRSEAL